MSCRCHEASALVTICQKVWYESFLLVKTLIQHSPHCHLMIYVSWRFMKEALGFPWTNEMN
jgi:hypothetical protein